MGVSPLSRGETKDRNLLETVKALLEESEDDRRSITLELRKKEAEIQEKLELISYLKGEKTPQIASTGDPDSAVLERKITEIDETLRHKIGELGQVKANVENYDKRITDIEIKADKIASFGDKALEVLKNKISSLNKEIISREEIISELKFRRNVQKAVNKELSSKVKHVKAGSSSLAGAQK